MDGVASGRGYGPHCTGGYRGYRSIGGAEGIPGYVRHHCSTLRRSCTLSCTGVATYYYHCTLLTCGATATTWRHSALNVYHHHCIVVLVTVVAFVVNVVVVIVVVVRVSIVTVIIFASNYDS